MGFDTTPAVVASVATGLAGRLKPLEQEPAAEEQPEELPETVGPEISGTPPFERRGLAEMP